MDIDEGISCFIGTIFIALWLGWIFFLFCLVTDFFDAGIAITDKI